MMKDKKKNKVGRPRLASKKIKKESILVCLFCLIIISVVIILELNTLNLYLNPINNVASVYNNNVNLCRINDDSVSCGTNVIYASIKIDNEEQKEKYKSYSNISFDDVKYNKIEVCYKTNKKDLECISKTS